MSYAEQNHATRVLMVGHNPSQAPLLQHNLRTEGFAVAYAPDARAALAMAKHDQPDVIVSDVIMPEMNGYELCAAIKDDRQLADVPVILVTALSDPQDVFRGLACRADHFLFKPYDAEHLVSGIQSVLVDKQGLRQDPPGKELEITFGGKNHVITADRPQILNLLLSTYQAAIQLNTELESRARLRTRELEQDNDALRQSTGRHLQLPFAARSLRVLLVDDDPALLESLRAALLDEGHKVHAANGGQAGIDAFRDAQRAGKLFDIVITDLGMPYVDGREVITSIRGMSAGTPIILLTGWGQHVLNERDRPPQVDRLLGKPPRIRELRAALAELTGRRATDRL